MSDEKTITQEEIKERLAVFREHLTWEGELVIMKKLKSSYSLTITSLGSLQSLTLSLVSMNLCISLSLTLCLSVIVLNSYVILLF